MAIGEGEQPSGQRQTRRSTIVVVSSGLALALITGGVVSLLSTARSSEQAPATSPTNSAPGSVTVSASEAGSPSAETAGTPTPGTQPAAPQPSSAAAPVISNFAATLTGVRVRVTFTVIAQPGTDPLVCNFFWGELRSSEPCHDGPVSKTYDLMFPGQADFSAYVVNRFGARSGTLSSSVTVPAVGPPTWSDGDAWWEYTPEDSGWKIYVAFTVSYVPGQDPLRCEIRIQRAGGGYDETILRPDCRGRVQVVSGRVIGGMHMVDVKVYDQFSRLASSAPLMVNVAS
jgi:hypothetical protein